MTFPSLGLSADLLRAISERNYPAPIPIRQAAIPAILEGRDVWACAQTGSGETLRGHQGLVGPSFSESGCRTLRSIMCASLRMRLISSSQW